MDMMKLQVLDSIFNIWTENFKAFSSKQKKYLAILELVQELDFVTHQ
jgi:sulfur transfer protein SufE